MKSIMSTERNAIFNFFILTKGVQQEKQDVTLTDSHYIIQNVFLWTLASVVWDVATAYKLLIYLY